MQPRHDRILLLAQALTYQNRLRPSAHSRQREGDRAIEFADAEATILSQDAQVTGENPHHPEGTTYTIAGMRFDGDTMHVVVAFNDENAEDATELRIVTMMYPEER
jgi:uncharacterized DUF497 family protein